MTDPSPNMPSPSPALLLRLPPEILTLILRNVWPAAVHIEAHPKRPSEFSRSICIEGWRPSFTLPDCRKKACAAICMPEYYDYYHDDDRPEWMEWHARRGSARRNHWLCEMWSNDEVRKVDKDKGPAEGLIPPDFMPVLLTCRTLYTQGLAVIGRYVEFSFTDLWTPLEFFGARAPPVAQHISVINLSANPSIPRSSVSAWPRFLKMLCALPSLREAKLWLELSQPVPDLAPDGGEQFKTLVKTLEGLEVPEALTLRVSVPLDPVNETPKAAAARTAEAHPPTPVRDRLPFGPDTVGVAEERRLANGVAIRRRGRVLYVRGDHGDGVSNEFGFYDPDSVVTHYCMAWGSIDTD